MRPAVFAAALSLALAPALSQGPSALAQDKPTAKGDPAPTDDIVVNGKRIDDKAIDAFVGALTPTRNGRQLARWNGQLCVKIDGLVPEDAELILRHIAAVARQIGVDYKEPPKCSPNTLIVFTSNADDFTAGALNAYPSLIVDVDRDRLPGPKQKARYLAPRPVRWFAVNATTMSDGTRGNSVDATGAVTAVPTTLLGSHIGTRTRENAIGALIVIDKTRIDGVTWNQLADYLAMVTFSQPAIDADFSQADSVMAIFAARDAGTPGVPRLTQQDLTFLYALYRGPADQSADQSRGAIAAAIRRGQTKKN